MAGPLSSYIKPLVRRITKQWSYRPSWPNQVDNQRLVHQAAAFFGIAQATVESYFVEYRQLHEQKNYAATLGERKTFCFEEAFLVFVAARLLQPKNVVEIGTQHGKSTRRIIDMLRYLKLDTQVTCFDIVDAVQFFTPDEARLVLTDVTSSFRATVLEPLAPELIYLDAHPYHLLKTVVDEFLEWSHTRPAVLAIHDCGPGFFNPHMRIPKDRPELVSTKTGVWERHVLCEAFAVPNSQVDEVKSSTHSLRVFDTPHGLALIAPRAWLDTLSVRA